MDGLLAEDDAVGPEVAVDMHEEGVTVTVTVSFGHALQFTAPCCAKGTALASPNREEMKIFECILVKRVPVYIGC